MRSDGAVGAGDGDSMVATTLHGPPAMALRARSTARAISAGSDGLGERELEHGLHERVQVGAGRELHPLQLWDRTREPEVGEVEGHDVDRVGDEGRVEVGEVGALETTTRGSWRRLPRSCPCPTSTA